ncbi:LysR family transcriptional regulator [Ruegeria lacuscaerulensis]|uniref:LysR family transcriptional regulator n=1 Tax=Ruegeria lacuscaerulensis TaxID=55218 RepID=UPI001F1CB7C8|nr:LysR family transcriptional regulator [Ruegeria lacuscaerulensis]
MSKTHLVPHMLPSLSALRAFDAAARTGSFRAAAEELSVTPTAISHHIRGLEAQLGAALFERTGRRVYLTPTGRRLSETTEQAFDMLAETVSNLRRTSRRVVRIAAGPIFTARWLMPRISEFWETHPSIELEVVPGWRPSARGQANADIFIRWERMADAPKEAEKLLELNPVAIASRGYLDRFGRVTQPRQLLELPILHQSNHWGWFDWFAAMGVQPQDPLHGAVFDDANVLLRGAADGQGAIIGWLPLIKQDLKDERIVRLFNEEIAPTHAYFVEMGTGRASQGPAERVRNWLLSCSG